MGASFSLWFHSLFWRKASSAEEPLSIPANTRVDGGELIWIHAQDSETARVAVELKGRLLEERPEAQALLTCPPNMVWHDNNAKGFIALPADDAASTAQHLSLWKPSLLIWLGEKLRAQMIHDAQAQSIPTLYISSPTHAPSIDAPLSFSSLRKKLISSFDYRIATSVSAASALRKLASSNQQIETLGRLSEGGAPLEIDEAACEDITAKLQTRPIWFASQVEPREAFDVLKAHRLVLKRSHRSLLIISPLDRDHMPKLVDLAGEVGLKARSYTRGEKISEDDQVLVISREETALWYRVCPVSFLGQSMVPNGGLDPFSAAAMGSAIVYGPHVSKYEILYDRLAGNDAAVLVRNRKELTDAVINLMSADIAALQANAAWEVVTTGAEATDRVCDIAQDLLDLRERA